MNIERWDYTEEEFYLFSADFLEEQEEQTNCQKTPISYDEKCSDSVCIKTIEKHVQLIAEVSITPHVSIHDSDLEIHCTKPQKTCIKKQLYCNVNQPNKNKCTMIIEQDFYIKIPLKFELEVDANTLGIK